MKKSCKLNFCFFLAKWFGSDWKMFLALLVVGMYLFCLLHQKIKSDKSDKISVEASVITSASGLPK